MKSGAERGVSVDSSGLDSHPLLVPTASNFASEMIVFCSSLTWQTMLMPRVLSRQLSSIPSSWQRNWMASLAGPRG